MTTHKMESRNLLVDYHKARFEWIKWLHIGISDESVKKDKTYLKLKLGSLYVSSGMCFGWIFFPGILSKVWDALQ